MRDVIHGKFEDNNLEDKIADLIIADPPYFEVKGEFDFVWDSFDKYLKDVEIWAKECRRLLKDNGTLMWWGSWDKIAYTQIILDKYFRIINSMVWQKRDSMQMQYYSIDNCRTFTKHNERLLVYESISESESGTGWDKIKKEELEPRNPMAIYLQKEMNRANIKNIDIAKLFPSKNGNLTGCVSNWTSGKNMPTKEQYLKIKKFLGDNYLKREYEDLKREYEDLKREYEDLRRYFNNTYKVQEVMNYPQEAHITKDYNHSTKKAEGITRDLIYTCCRKGGLVLVPFGGSGTECAMAVELGMDFIAYETNKGYVEMIKDRVKKQESIIKLFQ